MTQPTYKELLERIEELEKVEAERKQVERTLRESEKSLRSLKDNINVGIYRSTPGPEGKYLEVNPAMVKIFGYSSTEEFLQIKPADLYVNPKDRAAFSKKLIQTGKAILEEYEMKKKDGTHIMAATSVQAVKDQKGNIIYFDGIVEDITERKYAEATLRESEEKYRNIFESMGESVLMVDFEGKVVFCNRTASEKYGYSKEEFVGLPVSKVIDPDSPHFFRELLRQVQEKSSFEAETKDQTKQKTILESQLRATIIQVKDRAHVLIVSTDITQIKRVEAERDAEIRFLETMEQIDTVTRQASDLNKMMTDVLDVILDVFKCDRAWFLFPCDPTTDYFVVPMERTIPSFPGAAVIGKEIPIGTSEVQVLTMLLNSDGPLCFDPGSGMPVPEPAQRFGARSQIMMTIYPKIGKPWLLGSHQCSHERIWTNDDQFLFNEIGHRLTDSLSSLLFMQNLQQSEERFRELFTNIRTGVAVYEAIDNGRDFKFNDFNKAGEQIESTKKEDVIGKRITEVFPGVVEMGLVDTMKKVFETGQPIHHPLSFYKDKRISGWRENYVYKLSTGEIVCVYNDITEHKNAEDEKKKLQEQLFQAQKMESIGRLAGSIAHDFNNILTGLMGFAELLQFKNPDISTREGKAADSILKGTERAASLTRQLLGFARGGKSEFKSLNLNEIIRDTIRLSENLFEKSIRIKMTFTENLLNIEADRNQLDQMLTNLIINARDAMPRGGELQLKTENVLIKLDFAKIIPGVKPGHYVKFTISDTGIGMSKEVQGKIFEPFFTTKAEGVGTGLGLATVYGIIKNHKGHIEVNSQPGMGATFSVYFPGSDKPRQDEQAKGAIVSGEEAILVVDDEEGVRESVKLALEGFGYKVFSAANGIDAINLYKKNKGDIDLVLLDMIMPNMAGRETFFELKKLDSGVKVVLFSGYSKNEQAAEIINQGALDFLQKPYRLHDLIDSIRKALKK